MIQSIKISGFKNFRGKSIELRELKRINLLVGINGSGKSSVLELLMGVSKLSQLNTAGLQDVLVKGLAPRLHSLFEPETKVAFSYTTSPDTYELKITTQSGDRWQVEKNGSPSGSTEVVAIMHSGTAPFHDTDGDTSHRNERPFGGVKVFQRDKYVVLPDLDDANKILAKVNPTQRHLRKMNLSSGQFTFEENNEIRAEFLAGGSRYIAGLIAAIREMRNDKHILVIDDLGDELFPAVRKKLLPELNTLLENLPKPQFTQAFATTHNIEIVKSALDHPDYCSVYMFDYDGTLVEFQGPKQQKTTTSDGIQSADAVPAIAKMLGLDDLDIGFPEVVILTEEETKKEFLNGLEKNPDLKDDLRKFDVHVPFQAGDGNTSKAIANMLDLSKYLFFSEVWSERYAIFIDHNSADYEDNGNVKAGGQRLKALLATQHKLGLDKRFLLTKNGQTYVPSMEDTYPYELWQQFKKEKQLSFASIKDFLDAQSTAAERGQFKSKLAEFVGSKITKKQFINAYPHLAKLLFRYEPLPGVEEIVNPEKDAQLKDDMYEDAMKLVIEQRKASTSLLQRRLRIGYGRAARLIEELEENGIIGPSDGARPRPVLVDE